MKFEVAPNTPNAVTESVTWPDVRTTDDPAKVPVYRGRETGWWYGEGKNHRVVDGKITRDLTRTIYVLEINTLAELMALAKENIDIDLYTSERNPYPQFNNVY